MFQVFQLLRSWTNEQKSGSGDWARQRLTHEAKQFVWWWEKDGFIAKWKIYEKLFDKHGVKKVQQSDKNAAIFQSSSLIITRVSDVLFTSVEKKVFTNHEL